MFEDTIKRLSDGLNWDDREIRLLAAEALISEPSEDTKAIIRFLTDDYRVTKATLDKIMDGMF